MKVRQAKKIVKRGEEQDCGCCVPWGIWPVRTWDAAVNRMMRYQHIPQEKPFTCLPEPDED